MQSKTELRSHLRTARNGLDALQQQHAAENLLQQLLGLPAFKASHRVALYLANDGEISPHVVQQWLWQQQKQCYLPIVINDNGNQLLFAEVTESSTFCENRFGIAEPEVDSKALISANNLDLVLLPLVGFDATGNRIGMGGGFYDRTFAFVREQQLASPVMIGLAHEVQKVERIEAESWDIPLSTVVSDQSVYHF